jgi:hypothetical protein
MPTPEAITWAAKRLPKIQAKKAETIGHEQFTNQQHAIQRPHVFGYARLSEET